VTGYALVGDRAWGIALSNDEKTLYVANGLGDDITVVDVPSRKATASVPVGRTPYAIVIDEWSVRRPDGGEACDHHSYPMRQMAAAT
jgi:YVTN family beta-propeller protein